MVVVVALVNVALVPVIEVTIKLVIFAAVDIRVSMMPVLKCPSTENNDVEVAFVVEAFRANKFVEVAFVATRFEVDATERDREPPLKAPEIVRSPVMVPPESARYGSDGISDAVSPVMWFTVTLERLSTRCAAAKGAA